MSQETKHIDALIVGAGPCGIFQIFELGLLGIDSVIIDSMEKIGGQCSELYPDKPIYDIPGIPVCSAQELIDNLMEQIEPFNPEIYLGEEVVSVERKNEEYFVTTSTNNQFMTKTIFVAGGVGSFQARKIAFNLGLSGNAFKEMTKFVQSLYTAYIGIDASLFEINPVLKTSNDNIIAVDSKVTLDNNALFRHKDFEALRDLSEENPIEVEAKEVGLNYVDLDGNVGCMVNGAGLAMATMDLIKQAGGDPANFLDVGGTADASRVETAFRLILKDPNVKAILVNIFGGIVRCDRVAQGIVDAYLNMGDAIKVPIIVRLQGTNAKIAKDIIDNSGLNVLSAIEFQEAADKVQEALI